MDCCHKILPRNSLLTLCPFLFGISSWLGIYATFTQMPIIVKTAPEGWSLPSYVVVMIQIGNIGPLLYHFLQKHRPVKDSYLIYSVLSLGICGAVIFSQSYDITVNVFDDNRSLPLLGAVLLFSFMACTSSVLFMPYMGRFPESYMVKYFTGVSFGGLICSSITLMQGIGTSSEHVDRSNGTETVTEEPQIEQDQPNISVATFFLIISGIFVVSSVAFHLIDTLKVFKSLYANVEIRYGNDYTFNSAENEEMSMSGGNDNDDAATTKETNDKKREKQLKKLSTINYQNLLLLVVVISAVFNAIVPGLLSYATLPFGSHTYHYAIIFVYIGEPLAYIFGNVIPHSSIRVIWSVALFTIVPCTYLVINAVMSPYPPLIGTFIGSVLPVVAWTIAKICYAFINISMMSIFRDQGGKSLVHVGAYTQIGSFVGSALIFSLVNFTNIFQTVESFSTKREGD